MSRRIWKLEPLGKPSAAHAADAVEIVGGEAVRRVALTEIDYQLYLKVQGKDPLFRNPSALAAGFARPVEEIEAALRRLVAAGLIIDAEKGSLQ